jgi:hypothetical protein
LYLSMAPARWDQSLIPFVKVSDASVKTVPDLASESLEFGLNVVFEPACEAGLELMRIGLGVVSKEMRGCSISSEGVIGL